MVDLIGISTELGKKLGGGMTSGSGTAAGTLSNFLNPVHTGDQAANVTVDGSAAVRPGSYVVECDAAGDVGGTATFKYSRDGGSTFEGTVLPSAATITLSSGAGGGGVTTGVVVTLPTGGAGNDYEVGDQWTFDIHLQTASVDAQVVKVTTPSLVTPATDTDIIRVVDPRITVDSECVPVNCRYGTCTTGTPVTLVARAGAGYADVDVNNIGGAALNGTVLFSLIIT